MAGIAEIWISFLQKLGVSPRCLVLYWVGLGCLSSLNRSEGFEALESHQRYALLILASAFDRSYVALS